MTPERGHGRELTTVATLRYPVMPAAEEVGRILQAVGNDLDRQPGGAAS
jgi:hypothetical protein